MDAIKKKMQAMKVDKDGALERALVCEQEARDANTRAEKVSPIRRFGVSHPISFSPRTQKKKRNSLRNFKKILNIPKPNQN